jgi:superfamily I DNA/RNA helicase
MIHAHDPGDARVLDAPLEGNLLLIGGATGSGKTEALAARYVALVRRGEIAIESTLVAAAGAEAARDLAARIANRLDPVAAAAFAAAPFTGITLDELAFAIVADGALAGGLAPDIERLEPYEAATVFERAAAPLFSAEWAEYLGTDIDPEISGLRTPDRFADAVLRLVAKLRDAGIGPEQMLQQAQRGAAAFYANPPNLTEPGLLYATKDDYRNSLLVSPAELERQRRREIDLAKIVAKLYRSYLDQMVRNGCLGAGDAIAEATRILGESPALARAYGRLRLAIVDDAQDLRPGEVRLLQSLFGAALPRVTFAGSLHAAVQTFAGARPEATFKLAASTIVLPGEGPMPAQVAAVAKAIAEENVAAAIPPGDAVRIERFPDHAAEIAFVADAIAAHVAAGTAPARIAVVHRTARCLEDYAEAIVAHDVPVAAHGDIDLLNRHDAGDALAVLWAAVDPFHHAWLLRALQLPQIALSDASLAILCGEPSDPQAMLFALPEPETQTDRRWDRRRDVRLATNVLRGERDHDLSELARERVVAFRARRASWAALARDAGAAAARPIVVAAGTFLARDGETPARTAYRAQLVEEVLALIERYAAHRPGASLEDALVMLERVAPAERGPDVASHAEGVFVGAIDRIGPRRFEHVYVVDARAGSFPPYYVPDAFLFSPKFGMVPKDAAGDAPAARTAKFTWYAHQAKLKDVYAREHRRLLALAMLRADRTVTITACGKATRGIGAPEFVSELQALVRA